MIRTLFAAASVVALALPAAAQTKTGYMVAQCQINDAPAQLALQYEAIGGSGITYGPGVNPDITGVISDGSTTYYWNGTLTGSFGQIPISGENYFLRFYDQNAYNRETVLEVTMTGPQSFYLEDVYGNYPGQHPCQITDFQ
ncbi:MAG: hypothetical protein AAFW65_03135 [Pseudomonadota bacterium]